jgi:hypothetical protein
LKRTKTPSSDGPSRGANELKAALVAACKYGLAEAAGEARVRVSQSDTHIKLMWTHNNSEQRLEVAKSVVPMACAGRTGPEALLMEAQLL